MTVIHDLVEALECHRLMSAGNQAAPSADQVYGGLGTDAPANDPLDTYTGVEQLLS